MIRFDFNFIVLGSLKQDILDFTINWTFQWSEGTPISDYQVFHRDSEIARTEEMSTYFYNSRLVPVN